VAKMTVIMNRTFLRAFSYSIMIDILLSSFEGISAMNLNSLD
jgi:hypothetical protein